MSKMPPEVNVKEAVIKPEVLALAEKLKKMISLDTKSDKAIISATVEEGAYVQSLPDTLTRDIVKAVQDHDSLFLAAGALALGETAIAGMKKAKGVDRVELKIPRVGKDNYTFTFDRVKQVPNRTDTGVDGTRPKYGSMAVGLDIYGTRPNGELKKIRDLLSADALSTFGG